MTTRKWSSARVPASLFMAGVLLLSSFFCISVLSDPADSRQQEEGVWATTKMWADSKLLYDAEVGDFWPEHPGNEVVVGGESNWTTMLYGHEDAWEAVRLFEEAWYVTNIAIGDADPDEPGLEIVNVGWHGNISMVYWEDSGKRWRHKELVNGLKAGIDWGYGVAIDDFDPRYDGNEILTTDDIGQLSMVRKEGGSWVHDVIWVEGGPGIIDNYLDTVHYADFDPVHPGKEILVAGGSKWLTELFYNGSGTWAVKRVWKDRLAPVQVAIADVLDQYDGPELLSVGLTNNLTVLHWNGTAWEPEKVYTDGDVIYDVDVGGLVPGKGDHILTAGWSFDVVTHQHGPQGWSSEPVFKDDDFVFGATIGDFDDLHPGNETVIVDRSGVVWKLQYETPDFVLYSPSTEVSASAGSSANFDVMVYSRAGFDEEVALEAVGLPGTWTASASPVKVVPTGFSRLKVDVPADAVPQRLELTLKGTSATKAHSLVLAVKVLPPGEKDFSVKASPSAQSVVADYSAAFTVVSEAMNGFSDQVSCSVAGLPDGATPKWSSETMTPPGSVTLTVATLASTPKGAHYMTVTCSGGGKSHSTTVTLTVKDANSPDFSVTLAPSTVEAVGSRSVEVQVKVISLFGFSDQVVLTASGMPDGMNAVFFGENVTPTGTSTLNITTDASLPKGTYYIEVTGTSGATVHGAALRINLNTMGVPDFVLEAFPGNRTVTAGALFYFNVSLDPVNDFYAGVDLSISGLPADTVAGFEPGTIRPYEYAVLELDTSISTPAGSYELTVTGKGSGLTRSVVLRLEVEAARPYLDLLALRGPSTIIDGQSVRWEVHIENRGFVNATDVGIELLVDDKVVASKTLDLPPISGDVAYLAWKAEEGKHKVVARIVDKGDADIGTGTVSKNVDVAGAVSVQSGLLPILIVAVVVVLVVVVVAGYMYGRRMALQEEGRRKEEAARKRTRRGGRSKGTSKKGERM